MKTKSTKTPTHMKYVTKPTRQMLEAVLAKPKPSTLLRDLQDGPAATVGVPKIIEFLDMQSNTTQVESIVSINVPLFQPFPAHLLIKE